MFASGDSITNAELVACCPRSLRTDPGCLDPLVHHYLMLEEVFNLSSQFDLIHFHVDYLHFPLSRRSDLSQLTTLHGRLDLPDLAPLYRQFHDMPLVSISDAQRRRSLQPDGWGRSTMGCRNTSSNSTKRPAITWPSGSHLAGEASGSRHRDREASPGCR